MQRDPVLQLVQLCSDLCPARNDRILQCRREFEILSHCVLELEIRPPSNTVNLTGSSLAQRRSQGRDRCQLDSCQEAFHVWYQDRRIGRIALIRRPTWLHERHASEWRVTLLIHHAAANSSCICQLIMHLPTHHTAAYSLYRSQYFAGLVAYRSASCDVGI